MSQNSKSKVRISDLDPKEWPTVDWKCTRCGKQANYHVGNGKVQLYYCNFHWAVRMGFGGNRAKKA